MISLNCDEVSSRGRVPDETELVPGQEDGPTNDSQSVNGWRLHILTVGLWMALFLSTVETTIVSTSLVSITDALSGFDKRDWIVTAYLLTYTGFLTIYAKLGDVFGRKTMFVVGLGSFIISSILCGISTRIEQLIVFRAFQGFGASGIYSMTVVIGQNLVPPHKMGKYIAILSTVYALASVVGPLMGGAISQSGNWRWVFLFNAPVGTLATFIIIAFLPPTVSCSSKNSFIENTRHKLSPTNLQRVDSVGAMLLLAASILLVYAFESGGAQFPWRSVVVIVVLIIGAFLFIAFCFWEWWLQNQQAARAEPVFPPRILQKRIMAAMFATSFFAGFPFTSVVVNMPQRAQAVYAYSPQHAGITLLPLLLCSPLATLISGYATSNFRVSPVYLIISGAVVQAVGVGLTCSLPSHSLGFPPQQYVFEAIMGVGFGLTLTNILTLVPLVANSNDLPVTMGALSQVRILGGTLGLAVSATVLNSHISHKLKASIQPETLQAITDSFSAIDLLSFKEQQTVRVVFSEGFNKQNIVLAAFSGAALIGSMFLWEKSPQRVIKE